MADDYLTLRQAGKLLGLSKRTIKRYLDRGILHGVRWPAGWRVPRAEIERLMTEGAPRKVQSEPAFLDAPRCQGVKTNGEPCEGPAVAGTRFCRWHQDQEGA